MPSESPCGESTCLKVVEKIEGLEEDRKDQGQGQILVDLAKH